MISGGTRRAAMRRQVRRAFTLVEILVSVAIIGILLTAVAIASVRMLAGAREQQTRTTIKKIDEILTSRMAAFERSISGRSLAGGGSTDAELLSRYEHLRLGQPAMQRKRLFARFFGMSFGETFAYGDGTGSTVPYFAADLTAAELAEAGFNAAAHRPETENPEMLYWIVVNGPTFGSDVQADFNSSEVADTDGDGLMEFIDAWGNPIRYYRWPTRLLRPGPPAEPVKSEPGTWAAQGDPYFALGPSSDGQLANNAPANFLISSLPSYKTSDDTSVPTDRPRTPLGHDSEDAYGDVLLQYMQEGGTPQTFEQHYHTLNTWHAPLIVSAGADGVLGLFEPTDRSNFGHLAQPMPNAARDAYSTALQDNITNLNGRGQ